VKGPCINGIDIDHGDGDLNDETVTDHKLPAAAAVTTLQRESHEEDDFTLEIHQPRKGTKKLDNADFIQNVEAYHAFKEDNGRAPYIGDAQFAQ